VDLNGNGQIDILSGSYSRMDKDMAGLFQVIRGNKDRTFRKAEVLNGTDGQPLIIPAKGDNEITEKICTRPFAVDWDGDGKLDLVVGNFSGTFYWFKGEGKGKFAPTPQLLMADGKPLKLPSAHSDPFVVDWKGDGVLHLLSGCADGGIYWAENRAGKGKLPDLQPFKPLIKPPSSKSNDSQLLRESDLTGPSHASRIWVADVNGDGKLDILVGDSVHLISPAKGLTEEEFKMKSGQWQKEFDAAMKALNAVPAKDEKAQAKAIEEYQKVYERRSEFMVEERTGFVWLYLQK
jgi:FG-GAP-like repeat